jgi:hypothetical protein
MNRTKHLIFGMSTALLVGSSAGCGSDSNMGMNPQVSLYVTPLGPAVGQVVSMPAAISCPSACTAMFDQGTQVTLSVQPLDVYQFVGWGGACSGSSLTCSVPMTDTQNVSYTFAAPMVPAPVALTGVSPAWVAKTGGAQITITGSGFQPGSQVTIAGAAAQSVLYVSPTQLKITVGTSSKAGCAPIVVKNPDGQMATLAKSLAYLPTTTSFGTAKTTTGTAQTPKALQAGDFDRDGKMDLLVAHNNSGKVQFLKGNGDGTFQTPMDVFSDQNFYDLWVGDLDKDGKLDALALSASSSKVFVLSGNGDGSFTKKNEYATGLTPYALAVADVNGDGKPDAVTANNGAKTLSVLLGKGDGTFQAAQDSATTNEAVRSVAVADVDLDGKPDVVTVSAVFSGGKAGKFFVFLGNGDGTLQAPVSYPGMSYFHTVAAGDLDGDGYPELAGTDNFGTTVLLRHNNGDGTYPNALNPMALGMFPSYVGIFDVDLDGKLDVVGTSSEKGVSYFLNLGNGSFAPSVDFAVGAQPEAAIFTDLDGDCLPDFATANLSSNSVSVITNTSQ